MTPVRLAIALSGAVILATAWATASSSAAAPTKKLYAFMDGKSETREGDADGHARIGLTFDRGARRVCFDIRKFKLETAAAAHIHRGRKGKDGPIVLGLFTKPTGAGRGKVTGCARNVPRTAIDRIIASPGSYYANIHTARYPAGSVRGQLTTRKLV